METQVSAEAGSANSPASGKVHVYAAGGLPVGVRARVWIKARHFFSPEYAKPNCWLWMMGDDGRIQALRMDAVLHGRDDLLAGWLATLDAKPDAPIPGPGTAGTVWPLPGAPAVPAPRWNVSWGHPLQAAIRDFADKLDAEVLAALGRLEVPGPFFGSVANYNRLAPLPQQVCRHRLQALDRFPPLIAPLLLDVHDRSDHLFGTDEDEPAHRACCAPTAQLAVLDAMDRGRDLIGALANHYRIDRALARSPMFREPWKDGLAPRALLRLLHAIPAHARPQARKFAQERAELFAALPINVQTRKDTQRAASAFAHGWDKKWQRLELCWQPLHNNLRDSRDFLRAALEQTELPRRLAWLDMETLALAWLARRGIISLVAASLRWHARPLIELVHDDRLADTVQPLFGSFEHADGRATELTTHKALIAEGETMHHCVGDYWSRCVLEPKRFVHVNLADGSTATAQYDLDPNDPELPIKLGEVRGPCNESCALSTYAFLRKLQIVLDSDTCRARLAEIHQEARRARAKHKPAARRTLRPLDSKSCVELEQVLAYCAQQADWRDRPLVLFRGAIAGFDYSDGPSLLPQLDVGDLLHLVREPRNPHDENAVRIDWNGHKLGYVPRRDNTRIAHLLDAGEIPQAHISKLHPNNEYAPVECCIERAREVSSTAPDSTGSTLQSAASEP